jgi:hypothetical protein|tara:strand:- start:2071 stop:2979 length:909 start_codon:yes stop_codon:yes gene_type:complete
MSDVWENQTFVKVWDEESKEVKTITIYTTNLSSRCGCVSEVDAPAHIIATYKAAQDRKARIRAAREELDTARRLEKEAQEELKKVVNGREVVVVKGRKVPVGTRGLVRWMGATEWGYRVGIAVTGQPPKGFDPLLNKLTYTSISNCEALVAGLEPNETPVGGWAAYRDAVIAAETATIASRPKKGHRVRVIADGTKGTLFWINGDRCGVDTRPVKEQRGRSPEPLWLPLDEVERLDGSRSTIVAAPVAVPAPKKEELRWPYNEVCFVDGADALNYRGEVIATLTERGRNRLVEQNPEIRILV